MRPPYRRALAGLFLLGLVLDLGAQAVAWTDREHRIAARFAPDFHQMVDRRWPRLDYLTRFDFDGNWRSDDNWRHAGEGDLALPASVYFAVAETRTHFFVHYILFHPRDWKGNWLTNGALQLLKLGGRLLVFPRKIGLDSLSLAHENDLEGVLLVVERDPSSHLEGQVVLVESFSHHRFQTYYTPRGALSFEKPGQAAVTAGERVVLFIESRGHGVRRELEPKPTELVLRYRFTGVAEEPGPDPTRPVGYDLLPLHETLWKHALDNSGTNRTFSKFRLYDQFELSDFFAHPARIGTALRGRKQGRNRAVAPWGWKNNGVRGQWFFDPARNIADRHRPRGPFALDYLFNRFLASSTSGSSTGASWQHAPEVGSAADTCFP